MSIETMLGKTYILFSIIVVTASLVGGCSPDQFFINRFSSDVLYGKILSSIDSVEVPDDRELVVHGGGRAALRNWRITQFELEFYATVERGEGAIFYTRTVPVEYVLSPALALYFTSDGCRLEEDGQLLTATDTIRATRGEPQRVRIRNDGKWTKISIGCDVLYYGPSKLPATEFLVVEGLPGAVARVEKFTYRETILEEESSDPYVLEPEG